jgi:hypothetical protein
VFHDVERHQRLQKQSLIDIPFSLSFGVDGL